MPVPNEIIQEFLVETHDSLGRLDVELVALEKGEAKSETLGSVFRAMHSLKGSAGFLGFQRLESLTHVAESLLSRLRDGKLTVTVEIVSALLATVDAVREMLRSIELNGQDGEQAYSDLIARLRALTANEPEPASSVEKLSSFHDQTIDLVIPEPARLSLPQPPIQQSAESQPVRNARRKRKPKPASDLVIPPLDSVSDFVVPPSGSEIVVPQSGTSKVADSTIRLGVERVDKMMNLVTELVLSRNQIMQHAVVLTNSSLAAAARNLNLITSELQESVMRMRMQPISNVWGTLPRVVRDLSLECGKRVRLVMEGADTELDKSVLEAIKDPLMHLVRNAIDHGLEMPDVRQSRGKPPEGCLRLRAYHESGHIHIEISDDGAGVDRVRVKAKARERGLLTPEQAENLSDDSILSLIFLPGFSTRDAVNSLSGRGVGMDVVKSNVERIGGQVDVQSAVGAGTTFKLRIPLTLAIIHALMVTCAGERYAVPQTSMIELIRLDGNRVKTGIERIHGVRVHRYRGKLLPLVSLTQVLGGDDENDGESVNLIVLQADQQQFGLIVDRVNDTQEIVVKPLNKLLRGISCLAGATILGDGQVALILDVTGLAERALGEVRKHTAGMTDVDMEPTAVSQDMQQVVLVSGPRGERLAVPLSAVARLEEFPATKIEWTGTRPVIQYRDQILPLVDVLGLLERLTSVGWDSVPTGTRVGTESQSTSDSLPIQVVVCTDGASYVGLVVGRILDIVTDPLLVRSSSAREHVLFTAVVQRQVTEVLNVSSLISASEAEMLVAGAKA
ncbi:MAG: chemotaxis protein CheA [Planctomycetaceae bacterium]|nr:chemotaxis protein CheA [Planctomycetaceae bacterium]